MAPKKNAAGAAGGAAPAPVGMDTDMLPAAAVANHQAQVAAAQAAAQQQMMAQQKAAAAAQQAQMQALMLAKQQAALAASQPQPNGMFFAAAAAAGAAGAAGGPVPMAGATATGAGATAGGATAATAATIAGFGAAAAAQTAAATEASYRLVPVPAHRLSPLSAEWANIYKPLVEHMKLQVRFNQKKHAVEMKTSAATTVPGALQKSVDFVRAFLLGFELRDAIALLRLEDIYIDSFEITDVKRLEGEHLARAIGRIAGHEGKTKFTIENATQTRIVLADTHIHILGSFQHIRNAKDALVNLIRGSAPGKVYTQMRGVANRQKER